MNKKILFVAIGMILSITSCGPKKDNSSSNNGSSNISENSSLDSNSTGTSNSSTSGNGTSSNSSVNSESSSSNSESSSSSSSSSSSTQPSTSSTPSGEVLPAINHIKVLVKNYTHIYAWNDNNGSVTEYVGKWPGVNLTKYDDTWMCYDFDEGLTSVNVIFNMGGQSQTADLSVSGIGYHWYDNNKWSHSDIYGGDFTSNPRFWD